MTVTNGRVPFEPIDGVSQAEKVRLWLRQQNLPFETVLTFEQIAQIAGVENDKARVQRIVHDVKRLVQLHDQRTLAPVKNIGYRIVRPSEHIPIGDEHGRRAKRQVKKQIRVLAAADENFLSPEERFMKDRKLEVAQRHSVFLRRRSLRSTAIDKVITRMQRNVETVVTDPVEETLPTNGNGATNG